MVGKIYKLGEYEYWYDYSCRCWFGVRFVDGHQEGDAIDAYRKEDLINYIKTEMRPGS